MATWTEMGLITRLMVWAGWVVLGPNPTGVQKKTEENREREEGFGTMLSRRLKLNNHDDDEDWTEETVPEPEITLLPNDFVNPADRTEERRLPVPEITLLPSTPRTPQPPKEEGVEDDDLLVVSAWTRLLWNYSIFLELSKGKKPSGNRMGDYGLHIDFTPRKIKKEENGKQKFFIWAFVVFCVCLSFLAL